MSDTLQESYFRGICCHSNVAIIATDENMRIRFCNEAACRLFNRSADKLLGQPISSFVPDKRHDLAVRQLERTLKTGETSEVEYRYNMPDSETIHLAISLSPIIDENNKTIGASVFVRDITRQVNMLRNVAETQKMAALGSMAGAIAHHFNNVLGGIITSIDFAQTSDNTDTLRRAVRAAVSALSRANHLTQSLMTFAEGDHRESLVAKLYETIKDYTARITPNLAEQDITVETDLEPVPTLVPAKQITTILENLTNNAVEAMEEGGTLRFQLSGSHEYVLLRISDTGPGIAEECISRIFEPFFTTRHDNGPVTSKHEGLGLAVVHGIVRDLGGTVTLATAASGGAVCSILLPANIASEPS